MLRAILQLLKKVEVKKMKHMTIKDVAAKTGVSVSTVSRVLNNAKDVNEKTRTKILQTIAEFNYKPNPAAKALVNQSNRFIGVLVPNLNHSVISRQVRGIMKEAQKNNVDVLLFDYDNDLSLEMRQLKLLSDKMLDGAIIITSIASDDSLLNLAKEMPIVLIECKLEGIEHDQVEMDDAYGMKLLINHLRSKGHEKIGLLMGEAGTNSADVRSSHFLKIMDELNVNYPFREYLIDCPFSLMGGFYALQELVRNKPGVTAVIGATDQIAIGALGAAYQLGIKVPEQLSVVGYDNFDEGQISAPPLTTLSYPAERSGELATKYLFERINNPQKIIQKKVLPMFLLERMSVAAPRKEKNLNI